MKILFVILTVAIIGVAFPSAFADIYVHESSFPFSIQHPSEWKTSPEDEWGGVSFDSDKTNRNGIKVQ